MNVDINLFNSRMTKDWDKVPLFYGRATKCMLCPFEKPGWWSDIEFPVFIDSPMQKLTVTKRLKNVIKRILS